MRDMKINILLFSFLYLSLASFSSCKRDATESKNGTDKITQEDSGQSEIPKDFNINDYKVNPWTGSYYGIVPMEGTEGLEILVTLEFDGRSHYSTRIYNSDDVGETSVSRAVWDATGKYVSVKDYDSNFHKFLYEDGKLIKLDDNGNRYTGANANKYILNKSDDF